MDIARKIRDIRESRGLSQAALARLAGVAQASISAIETGKQVPTVEFLARLCHAVGMSLRDFFSDDDAFPDANDPVLRRILGAARRLEPHEAQSLAVFLESIVGPAATHAPKPPEIEPIPETAEELEQRPAAWTDDRDLAPETVERIKRAQEEVDRKYAPGRRRTQGEE